MICKLVEKNIPKQYIKNDYDRKYKYKPKIKLLRDNQISEMEKIKILFQNNNELVDINVNKPNRLEIGSKFNV